MESLFIRRGESVLAEYRRFPDRIEMWLERPADYSEAVAILARELGPDTKAIEIFRISGGPHLPVTLRLLPTTIMQAAS